MRKPVLCLGLTPAIQRVLVFDTLLLGEVNRAVTVHTAAAGKAVNTAKVLSLLGDSSILCGFNGGSTGRTIHRLLQGTRILDCMTETATETRICTTLIARSAVTELVEEASPATPAETKAFEKTVLNSLPETAALVITGTLPKWLPISFYLRFVQAAHDSNIPVFIDSHDVPLLETLSVKPYFIKMNRHEFDTTGYSAEDLLHRGAQNLLITAGPHPAELYTANGIQILLPPILDSVVNPIGSGDSVTAGIVHSILAGKTLTEACIVGLACGGANALSLLPGEFTREQLVSLLKGNTL